MILNDFGWILEDFDGFWMDFGWILQTWPISEARKSRKIEKKKSKKVGKIHQKTLKNMTFIKNFWNF